MYQTIQYRYSLIQLYGEMTDRTSSELTSGTLLLIGVGVVLLGGSIGLFVADFGTATPEPVAFDETVAIGLTLEDELRLEDESVDVELPRMQVFYSQYPYVVGYYGIESFVTAHREPTHEQQFGFPTVAYVTDYTSRGIRLTADGLPETRLSPGWIAADEAYYVIDSEARTPSGETIVPFRTTESAEAFTEEYGGTVVEWDAVLQSDVEVDDAETVRTRLDGHRDEADRSVVRRMELADRPVGAVVGENGTTLQDAIDAAPSNTTVLVPNGTHSGPIEIDHPVTLRGSGDARIEGDGNGTVVTVTAPETAIVGVAISGVGDTTPGPTVTDDHAHGGFSGTGGHDHGDTDGDDSWDAAIDDDYAGGDSAVSITTADGVLVADTEIHTDAAGVIVRDSPDFVVSNVTVNGSANYREGHMGVAAMRSVGVVEHSTFIGGLDGVYTHRADGIVVRNNEMYDNRMGVHLMFTSDALLADNAISGQEQTGIYVMTGPQGNGIVGNEITETWTAISVGGSDSYVADNVLSENDLGMRIDATASIFERNVIVDNRNGVETWALLPTNRVTRNDFVGNDRHVPISSGRLRVWTHNGEGNYWEGAIGTTDGAVIQRPYTPTDPIDGRLHRVDGANTLAQAPALDALAGFEGSVPGMRADGVIDVAPLCSPANEAWFERHGRTDIEPVCQSGGQRTENVHHD